MGMEMKTLGKIVSLLVMLSTAGCMMGPDFQRPVMEVSTGLLVPAVYQGASYAGHLTAAVDRVVVIVRFRDCSLPYLLGMREAGSQGADKGKGLQWQQQEWAIR